MQGLGCLTAIIIGGLAGWIGSNIMDADTGIPLNIILGVVGAGLIAWYMRSASAPPGRGVGRAVSLARTLVSRVPSGVRV